MLPTAILAIFWAFFYVLAAAVNLQFLNKDYQIAQGRPYTVRYSGCENGCILSLLDDDTLLVVQVVSRNATGSSITFTLDLIPTGHYRFQLTSKSTNEVIDSPSFGLNGPAPVTSGTIGPPEPSSLAPIPSQTGDASSNNIGLGSGAMVGIAMGVAALV